MLCYARKITRLCRKKEKETTLCGKKEKLRYANYGIPSNPSSKKSRVNENSHIQSDYLSYLTLSVCLSIFLPRLLTAHQNPSSTANLDEREHDGIEESVYGKQRLRRKWFPGRQLARQFCH